MSKSGKKLDLIPELTTHKNDYKPWPIPKREFPMGQITEEKVKNSAPFERIDYQSHTKYMTYVPFDLYLGTKPIVGKDPREPIPNFVKPGNSSVQEDRAFAFRLPGKSSVEVTEKDLKHTLMRNTYFSISKGLLEEGCLKMSIPPKHPKTVMINDKVGFEPVLYPPISIRWIPAAKHWDFLQSRILGDPTKTFWLRRGPEVESFSKANFANVIPNEIKQEIRTLIEEENLRLPYDVTKSGYGGYRQICAKNVPLRRKEGF